ncbi:MAG: biotin--[acetyl-CoA-carboxylase] ligase [Pseudomonadales bacterium]|jgi:BirA family biotin operon repressor/biotin-[acetyl-CoA-carboxylase] ligase|nr:biotin--[acetyl-CoA-carboxylase] ligase [Pseudomonadales bacterium]
MDMPLAPAPLLAVLRELAAGQTLDTVRIALATGLDEALIEAAQPQLVDHGVLRDESGLWHAPAGVDLLDRGRLDLLLAAAGPRTCRTQILGVTGSTNDDARELLERVADEATRPRVVLAEAQVAGRGRRGKNWQSPVASNLYLTQIEPLAGGPESAGGLSLVMGVAVADALERLHGIDVALKWPNDLLVGGRKLGGILVELAMARGRCHALIGIGVNVRLPGYVARAIDQPWIDLAALGVRAPARNETAAALISSVRAMAQTFRGHGFDARLRARWQARDPFFGREVIVSGRDDVITGIARGIDDSGELLVDTPRGRRSVGAGEVSIRLADDPQASPHAWADAAASGDAHVVEHDG